jgi:hypothetical protein
MIVLSEFSDEICSPISTCGLDVGGIPDTPRAKYRRHPGDLIRLISWSDIAQTKIKIKTKTKTKIKIKIKIEIE